MSQNIARAIERKSITMNANHEADEDSDNHPFRNLLKSKQREIAPLCEGIGYGLPRLLPCKAPSARVKTVG